MRQGPGRPPAGPGRTRRCLVVADGDRVVQGDVAGIGHLVAVVDDGIHGGVGGLLGGLVDR